MVLTPQQVLDKNEIKDGNGNTLIVQGTNNFLNQLESTVPATRKERSEIIEPGAYYAQDNLWKYAPEREHIYKSQNYLGSKWRSPQHLHDPNSVTHKPNQHLDGSTEVGFIRQSAPIAKWVDVGTYRQNGDSFMDRAYQGLDYDHLFGLERKAYENLIQKKMNNK